MVRPCEPLRRGEDFDRLYRHGRAVKGRFVVLRVLENDLGVTRVGITASRRVGKAVVRNRVKRRLREAVRRNAELLPSSSDMVVSARAGAVGAPFGSLCAELGALLGQVRRKKRWAGKPSCTG